MANEERNVEFAIVQGGRVRVLPNATGAVLVTGGAGITREMQLHLTAEDADWLALRLRACVDRLKAKAAQP